MRNTLLRPAPLRAFSGSGTLCRANQSFGPSATRAATHFSRSVSPLAPSVLAIWRHARATSPDSSEKAPDLVADIVAGHRMASWLGLLAVVGLVEVGLAQRREGRVDAQRCGRGSRWAACGPGGARVDRCWPFPSLRRHAKRARESHCGRIAFADHTPSVTIEFWRRAGSLRSTSGQRNS